MERVGGTALDINRLRTGLGWTQAQLARALGTDAVTVSRWERGVSHPRASALWRLSSLGLERGPNTKVGFVEDPAKRLRRLDRILKDQSDLKARARRIG